MMRTIHPNEMPRWLTEGCNHPDNHSVIGGLNVSYFISRLKEMVRAGAAECFGDFTEDGCKIRGAFAFVIGDDHFNGDRLGLQIFWFMFPEYRGRGGIRLLQEFERRAKERGCKRIQMPHQLSRQDEKFGKFLKRFGFKPEETSYFKNLEESNV